MQPDLKSVAEEALAAARAAQNSFLISDEREYSREFLAVFAEHGEALARGYLALLAEHDKLLAMFTRVGKGVQEETALLKILEGQRDAAVAEAQRYREALHVAFGAMDPKLTELVAYIAEVLASGTPAPAPEGGDKP